MRIFILGLHSPIGRHLANALISRGHQVSGTSRAAEPVAEMAGRLGSYHNMHLGDEADPDWFQDIDAVLYLIHDHSHDAASRNVDGIKALFQAAFSAGVPSHMFFTSYSAKPDSRSAYGAVKFELESFFRKHNQWVVRPGLVAGASGLFSTLLRLVQKFPILPLPDGGRAPVPLVAPESVSDAVVHILERALPPGCWNLHQRDPVSMRKMLLCMKRLTKSRCIFIPIPAILPLCFLRFTESVGLHLPLAADSIAAMRENRNLRRPSHLADLGVAEPPLEEMIMRLVRAKECGAGP